MSSAVSIASTLTSMLGEGPVWDYRISRLHYVDIVAAAVMTYDPANGIERRIPLPEMVGFVALTSDPEVLVAGLRGGLHTLNLTSGEIALLCPVEASKPEIRINDGTVAPDGAIVFGTMETAMTRAVGTFWRWHRGSLTRLGGEMVVTNGPAFAPDGQTALTVDSVRRTIIRHRYANGGFEPGGVFVTTPIEAGEPDGLAFDDDGCVWVCHFGGSQITRYRPDGQIDRVILLPASQITKCAFAGSDLRTLYVTSAARDIYLASEPDAGRLFKLEPSVVGTQSAIAII